MKKGQVSLALALFFGALFLLVLMAMTAVGGFVFGRASGIRLFRTVGQITGGLAAVSFLVAVGIIAVQAALQPVSRWRKLLYVLPVYFLGLLLVGALLYVVGVGTVGGFSTTWLAVSVVLSLVAALVTVARLTLDARSLKMATTVMGVMAGLSLIAWLAMIISLVMVLLSPPRAASPGGAGGGGFSPPGGGGPGGPAFSTTPLLIGGVLLTIFGALVLVMIVRGWRALRVEAGASTPAPQAARLNYRHEVSQVIISCAAITIVALIVIQLVPIAHTNPPAQTTVQWDSPQTEQLFNRACANCHSNATVWPWYSYVAPGSWLLASHVRGGRGAYDLSELNNLPAFRRSSLPNQIKENVQNGIMPPSDYLFMHPEARLTNAEKEQLIQGLQASLAK